MVLKSGLQLGKLCFVGCHQCKNIVLALDPQAMLCITLDPMAKTFLNQMKNVLIHNQIKILCNCAKEKLQFLWTSQAEEIVCV